MAKKSWEAYLETANKDLKDFGTQLRAEKNEDDNYDLFVDWCDGNTDEYATNYFESEMEELISEAWPDVRTKARQRGDRIIRCIVHVDTPDIGMSLQRGEFHHAFALCGSKEQAVRWINRELGLLMNEKETVTDIDNLESANAALQRKYGEPSDDVSVYASIDDITEEVIVKCSEAFCEHHWRHEALVSVADELGIDLYDIEKT